MQLMKGYTFQEAVAKGKVNYPVWVEPKIDDIRCQILYTPHDIEEPVQFLSYAGKPLYNMWFLTEKLVRLFECYGCTELDVGIEVNGNFNDSYRWVRSKNGPPVEKIDKATGRRAPALDKSQVVLHLFDRPTHDVPFEGRMVEVARTVEMGAAFGIPFVQHRGGYECLIADEVQSAFIEFREAGFEGAMVKDLHGLYERKRSWNWLKLKPSDEADGIITQLNRGTSIKGEPLDRCTSIQITMPDGSVAEPHGIRHSLGELMLQNPQDYLGRHATFLYMERDRAGGYRHPVFQRIREEK